MSPVVDGYQYKMLSLHWGVLPIGVSKFIRNESWSGIMKGDTPTSRGTLKPLLTTEVKGNRSCSSRSMTLELLMEALLLSRVMVLFLSPSSKTGTVRSHGWSQWEQGRLPWEGHVNESLEYVSSKSVALEHALSMYFLWGPCSLPWSFFCVHTLRTCGTSLPHEVWVIYDDH